MTKRKNISKTLIAAAKEMGFAKATVRRLKELDIPEVVEFTPKQLKKLRESFNTSQGVFAAYLNVNPSTIQKWEQGKVRPQNATLRLLNVINERGIEVLLGKQN